MAHSSYEGAHMEPLNDDEIKKVLVVSAHPDDSDFGASGTLASWIAKGIHVSYCICTNGDQGGEESGIPVEEMPAVRQREQRAAGKASTILFFSIIAMDHWLPHWNCAKT